MRSRHCLSAIAAILLLGSTLASAQDEGDGGAFDQLQNATSGSQTLPQTYGDSANDTGCPYSCPDGSEIGDIPEPPPPSPADSSQYYWQSEAADRSEKKFVAPKIAAVPTTIQRDEWQNPEPKVYYSEGRKFRFTVIPGDVLANRLFAQGVLEKADTEGNWSAQWKGPLVNEIAPVRVMVSAAGRTLVTIDDWYSAGLSGNAIAIYGANGELVRAMALKDMLPAYYIDTLPHSLSAIWWLNDHRFSKDGKTLFLTINLPHDKGSAETRKRAQLRITLADGKVAPLTGAVWKRALAEARPH